MEGPIWLVELFEARWADEGKRAAMLELAHAVEGAPELLGVSPHLLATAIA